MIQPKLIRINGKAGLKDSSGKFCLIDTDIEEWTELRNKNLYPIYSFTGTLDSCVYLLDHIFLGLKPDVEPYEFANNMHLDIIEISDKTNNELIVKNKGHEDPITLASYLNNLPSVEFAEIDYAANIKKY